MVRGKQPEKTYGVDLTFWSPKSVSLASLVGGDERLELAHRQAVKTTLEFVEENYAGAEVNGKWVQTKNLVVLLQHHEISRELDPELHTHCLVINLTQLPNGRWVDLSYQQIWLNQKLLEECYYRELAVKCQKLGYELARGEAGMFELCGYTKEQLAAFSKGGKKSCLRIPSDATYEYWRQCVEAGGLASIEEIKSADSRQL